MLAAQIRQEAARLTLRMRILSDRFHHLVDAVSLYDYTLSRFPIRNRYNIGLVPFDYAQDFEVSMVRTPVDDRATSHERIVTSLKMDLEGVWPGRVYCRYSADFG
jgi:hypothetical protein